MVIEGSKTVAISLDSLDALARYSADHNESIVGGVWVRPFGDTGNDHNAEGRECASRKRDPVSSRIFHRLKSIPSPVPRPASCGVATDCFCRVSSAATPAFSPFEIWRMGE